MCLSCAQSWSIGESWRKSGSDEARGWTKPPCSAFSRASCFLTPFGLRDLLQTALPPRQFFRQLIPATALAVLRLLGRFHILGLLQQLFNLRLQPLFALAHPRMTHGLVPAGVRLDLGSIDGHITQFHQTGLFSQQQDLCEQPRQRLQMPLAKLREGVVIWMRVGRKITESHVS